ncbi:FMN-binding protein [Fervidobacterium thailandense]|uniref:FMN-binding protein n=1 Tax=Fervidobacterium thailandense TaxID=1008305 RepID=A0A1E3G4U6_9BACT|nr:FMN-binding protein [Fervidobacterium thailandense]ODN31306.1 FMN-binding protein [Fervidobacterium thailandense]
MKVDKESKLYTVIFSFAVTFIFVFVLALLNTLTASMVQKNQEFFKIRAVLNALGIPYNSYDDAKDKFQRLEKLKWNGSEIFVHTDDGKKVYAIIFHGSGLWGPIDGVLAVAEDLETIVGLDFISQNETPGLGGRIEEKWFKDQFKGERAPQKLEISVSKTVDDKGDGKVDAISGATLTSKALEKILNAALETLRTSLNGGVDNE